MTSDEIRATFLSFFEGKGHKVIPSSSLIPQGDPTLLLTSAGMVQIKPYFLGEAVPPNPRLASCQKCFRTSDIESVGDSTHLTFFEMLGNFSVGDYFKPEAISWAWEFVTEHLRLPRERLWISIFYDDEDSFRYWRQIGVSEERIIRFGEEDNFWGPAGDSGPCGPCSEILYDFGEDVGCGKASCNPSCDCGRFSELWNLVFTQYNQDKEGNRTPLARPNIDTGMGLERMAAVMQGKASVYETDLFAPLMKHISRLARKEYIAGDDVGNAMRVIAEHSRGIAFLIGDGVIPENEGRGYVLRRILRRAALFGKRLGLDKPFLAETAKVSIEQMKHIYSELEQRQDFILKVIELEESRFDETLSTGLELEDELISAKEKDINYIREVSNRNNGDFTNKPNDPVTNIVAANVAPYKYLFSQEVKSQVDQLQRDLNEFPAKQDQIDFVRRQFQNISDMRSTISGKETFRLYDTYGFPVELTKEIAAKSGFSVDLDGFEEEMEKQRERAKAAHTFGTGGGRTVGAREGLDVEATDFVGYKSLKCKSVIVDLLANNQTLEMIEAGREANLILAGTPFYGEMGGQVGDAGEIRSSTGRFVVADTVRIPPDIIVHQGRVVEGSLTVGEEVEAEVDVERRLDIARNHTATHLLQAALRQVLGGHIQQRGSLVAPDHFRFDFSHLASMTEEEIQRVNSIVNDKIRQNLAVYDEELPYKEAIESGAIALFDEKYGDVVRVMRIGTPSVSVELCGGTHVTTTGEIGFFHIIGESSIGAGLRRIEAVTGRGAEIFIAQRLSDLEKITQSVGASPEDVFEKVSGTAAALDAEHRRVQALERELARKEADSLLGRAETVNGVNVLAARVSPSRMEILREMSDLLREKLKSAIVVLGTVYEDKPSFLAAVTPDLVAEGYDAGKIIKEVAKVAGGGGGGKASMAQAGGRHKDKLDEALRLVKNLIVK